MTHRVYKLILLLVFVAAITITIVLNTILRADDNAHQNTVREAVPTIAETNTNTDYILNTNTMKAHSLDCEEVNDISEEHILCYHGSAETLKQTGYSFCGKCKPWK